MTVQDAKDLVNQIRKRRKGLGITQLETGKRCGLSANGRSKFKSHIGKREMMLFTVLNLNDVLAFKTSLEFEDE